MRNYADVSATTAFFEKAYPAPLDKNLHTQLGVHFEEIAETLEHVRGKDRVTQSMLTQALVATHALALHLKANANVIQITDQIGFLDGLCDQMVTSIGVGHMAGMDMVGAFSEVNRSNLSKFGDNGEPILDKDLKLTKGPSYFKPNLKPFASAPLESADPA